MPELGHDAVGDVGQGLDLLFEEPAGVEQAGQQDERLFGHSSVSQICIWLPSSIARLGGMRKKVLVADAECESEMNQSRRHLPSLECRLGTSVSRPRKKLVSISS